MPNDKSGQPLRVWLPKTVLTFLVFLVLSFVVYQTTVGTGTRDIGAQSMWALIVAMLLLVLLPVVDRIQSINISLSSLEVRLREAKAQALQVINSLEDQQIAKVAREQVAQADSTGQVRAAKEMAVELNVNRVLERIEEAIHQKRKCYVRYRSDPEGPVETFCVAPLDIKPGKTPATKANDYLWAHSFEHDSTISLRLGRVLGAELSEETFDPEEIMTGWDTREPEWNVPREW